MAASTAPDSSFWSGRPVVVTGGASFIGSHLTDALVGLGAEVTVVDDLSSGLLANIEPLIRAGRITFHEGDLHDAAVARQAVRGADTVFHLAAAHGGRGYVDLHQAACATNLHLDGQLFQAVAQERVRKVVYASSGCIYPLNMQQDPASTLELTEDLAGPPYEPDGMYGNAKLMGELTLRAMHQEHGLAAASCRYFTVYGPRGVENHAVIAMMARALIRQSPFVVWGDGTQVRNWTYVSDIVTGTILAGERIDDGDAVNLGTAERITVLDAARTICELAGHETEFATDTKQPVGPVSRVASFAHAERMLGWRPQVMFAEGVRRTFGWYRQDRDPELVLQKLDALLTERGVSAAGSAGSRRALTGETAGVAGRRR